jgi:hypothetical protein
LAIGVTVARGGKPSGGVLRGIVTLLVTGRLLAATCSTLQSGMS